MNTGAGGAGELNAGELALLIDTKQRRYLLRLTPNAEFVTHAGTVPHNSIIGQSEGSVIRCETGRGFTLWRPLMSDYILKMKRGAQIIYPKDIGAILVFADIASGMKVFESGVGSGALSLALLRAGTHVLGYDTNEEFSKRAFQNVEDFLGAEALGRYTIKNKDSYQGIDVADLSPNEQHSGEAEAQKHSAKAYFDRALLDLPEPWRVVRHAREILRPGGVLLAYTPSAIQVSQTRQALEASDFKQAETIEIMQRGWYVQGAAVRPDHRMVGHTGFLTRARCARNGCA